MRSFEVMGSTLFGPVLVQRSEDGKPAEDYICAFTLGDAVWLARQETRLDDRANFKAPPLVDLNNRKDDFL